MAAFAGVKVLPSLPNQPGYLTPQVVAGANPNGDVIPIQVDSLGHLMGVLTEATGTVINFRVTIPKAGSMNQLQLPSNVVHSCLLQTPSHNARKVYYGGAHVTSINGTNEGIALIPGETSVLITLRNTNQLYVATDHANDRIKVLCN